jgi:Ca2+-transporting ATPase
MNAGMKVGLTHEEVKKQRLLFGANDFSSASMTSRFRQLLKVFQDPMGVMLLALGVVYFLLGKTNEAWLMLIAFVPVSVMDVLLELRAEKALSSLRATFQTRAKVWRDSILQEVPIQELVPGDAVALEEGQTVPADGQIHSASHLSVSEASLTGESLPIEKSDGAEIFAGTNVLAGRGIYVVTQTGLRSKFGKIIELVQAADSEVSPLQKKIKSLVSSLFKVAAVLILGLFLLQWWREKSILESLLVALTFGMASMPEEFPLVFTLYLSLGAWRLTKRGVLVKSLPRVETLGSVDVICTDKTGTLTEGRFQLTDFVRFSDHSLADRWRYALMACEPVLVDAMEMAIRDQAMRDLGAEWSTLELELKTWQLLHDYPFEFEGKHLSHAWRHHESESRVAMKGAIEGVLAHCGDSPERKNQILKRADELSSKGYRLLGLAGKVAPLTGDRETDESNMQFIGILAFTDPIRPSVREAIQLCQQEGIEIKMITGDHPLTAHAIADELNLAHAHDAIYTGAELLKMSPLARAEVYLKAAIFSRVTPEQKYELVKTLKEKGRIVAMTGDGVNDAPAMRVADIGISMGENATDAARATAGMVLTKSDFSGIVYAIREGRRIFSNLRRSFSYLISFHIPVVLLSFVPALVGAGELLLPIHIILLEMIVHPVSAFAFEGLSTSALESNQKLMDRSAVLSSTLAGVLVSAMALTFYFWNPEQTIEVRRGSAFFALLIGNIGFVAWCARPYFTRRIALTVLILALSTLMLWWSPSALEFLQLALPMPK